MATENIKKLSCSVCGDDWHEGTISQSQRQRMQVRTLRRRLESLDVGQTSVDNLKLRVDDMCRDCQMLFVAINGQIDFLELRKRILDRINRLQTQIIEEKHRGVA